MKKYLQITFLIIFYITSAQADHQKHGYDFFDLQKFKVEGSSSFYEFSKDLVQDKDIKQQITQKDRTGLISYLLFEKDKIIIDEQSLPSVVTENNGLLWSHSIGKSLVSYVTGHAICEGYIDSVDVILDDSDENFSSKMKKFNLIGVPYQILLGKKSSGDLVEFIEIGKNSQNLTLDEITKVLTEQKEKI